MTVFKSLYSSKRSQGPLRERVDDSFVHKPDAAAQIGLSPCLEPCDHDTSSPELDYIQIYSYLKKKK